MHPASRRRVKNARLVRKARAAHGDAVGRVSARSGTPAGPRLRAGVRVRRKPARRAPAKPQGNA